VVLPAKKKKEEKLRKILELVKKKRAPKAPERRVFKLKKKGNEVIRNMKKNTSRVPQKKEKRKRTFDRAPVKKKKKGKKGV